MEACEGRGGREGREKLWKVVEVVESCGGCAIKVTLFKCVNSGTKAAPGS